MARIVRRTLEEPAMFVIDGKEQWFCRCEGLELRIQSDLRDELVIHRDDGHAITVMVKDRFEAGQRVRVVSDTYGPYGPRVEHE
jgi:outer membrane lipoprotein SlyB